jgi:hypothetical protein
MGCADVLPIRIAFDPALLRTDALYGAVATLGALGGSTLELDQLSVIHVGTEHAFNRFQVRLVTVAGELDAVGEPAPTIVHEGHRVCAITTADQP